MTCAGRWTRTRLALLAFVGIAGDAWGEGGGVVAWNDAFDAHAAPATVHVRAQYKDAAGKAHALELWRQGDTRLVRKTDERLALHAERKDDGGYAYTLVDRARRLVIDVRQDNLYRIGRFSDWRSLSTMLTEPAEPHRVVDLGRTQRAPTGECHWYRVEVGAVADEVCWSRAWGVPLMLQRGKGQPTLTLEKIDRAVSDAVFRIEEPGFTRIHADEDIHPAGD